MTDKEIIKALECCADESIEYCQVCPYMFDTIYCDQMKLRADALDLVNRQQEQLDAVIAGQETLQKALAEKDKEIEQLTAENDRLIETFGECQERAIKDFAKAVIDGIDEGYILHSSDIVDFTADYLRGKGDAE